MDIRPFSFFGPKRGSFEKITDNEFEFKFKTSEIETPSVLPDVCYHCVWWTFGAGQHDIDKRVYYMKCNGPRDDLWNIDANVTFEVTHINGTRGYSRPINVRFNRGNPVYTYEMDYYRQSGMCQKNFDEYWHDLAVRVKINSITGVVDYPDEEDFEKKDDQLSDVALVVEGKKLYANKAVLATFSPVFRSMFYSGFKESTEEEVVIKDVYHEDFTKFLTAIHDPSGFIDIDDVESLLLLADRYDVRFVRENCKKYMLSPECELSLTKLLILAETYTFPDVHEKCMNLIDTKEKLKEVSESSSVFGIMTLQALNKKLLKYN